MNAIPNPFAPTPPPTLPTVPEKGPGGWGNDTASVVDALLEPVFAEYPLVDEQVKDLISRSFEEFMGTRKEMRSEKKDQMVIRKLKSRYPEKMGDSLYVDHFILYLQKVLSGTRAPSNSQLVYSCRLVAEVIE